MADDFPHHRRRQVLLVGILLATALVFLSRPAPPEDEAESLPESIVEAIPELTSAAISPHFPKPPALYASVEFWKRMFTEFGVGDFVLHDRDNLQVIYDVVQVSGTTNERRAQELAKPAMERARDRYEAILVSLARGIPPEALGFEGRWVDQAWGCPCPPEFLLHASGNIRAQQGLREKVEEGMLRARPLMPRILAILRRHKVPEELAALPMVESSFNPHARSKAGAVGLWQILRSTGRRYLNVSHQRDDRRDPIQSTEVAARLLRQKYQALGSWPLAVVAYNHGTVGVHAARAAVGSDAVEDIIAYYSGRRFGFASRNFYPEFLAALEIIHPTILEHTPQPPDPKRYSRLVREG